MLSDLMMADLDGMDCSSRTKEKFPDMPVVMVLPSRYFRGARRHSQWRLCYLLKPFEREQLLNAVAGALENRRLKVENRTYQTNWISGRSPNRPTSGRHG